MCPLAFPLRQERVFPSSFGPHIFEAHKSSSPHAASFRRISAASFRPLSGVLRLSGLFQASFRRHISFRRISAASFRPLSGLFQPLSGVLPLSGATFLFLRHNAQAASIWPRKNTPANALLLHVCPHTAYCSACVRIPGTNCRR